MKSRVMGFKILMRVVKACSSEQLSPVNRPLSSRVREYTCAFFEQIYRQIPYRVPWSLRPQDVFYGFFPKQPISGNFNGLGDCRCGESRANALGTIEGRTAVGATRPDPMARPCGERSLVSSHRDSAAIRSCGTTSVWCARVDGAEVTPTV